MQLHLSDSAYHTLVFPVTTIAVCGIYAVGVCLYLGYGMIVTIRAVLSLERTCK